MISVSDIAWAAGLYEGEGSFIMNKIETNCNVSMTQKDPWPLIKLQSLFGGEVKPYGGYNYWRLYGAECRGFVLSIFTFLSPRRRQQILKHREFFTTPDTCPNDHPYLLGSYKMEMQRDREVRVCLICRQNKMDRKLKIPREQKLIKQIAASNGISIEEAENLLESMNKSLIN